MNQAETEAPQGPPLTQYRTHGDLVFTSGQIGLLPDGAIPEDFGRQAHLAIQALKRQLEAAGASLETTIKTTVFVTRHDDFAAMNQIYTEYFHDPWPARSTVVTGLALPGLLFEIEAVAHRG
ncbi:MAG TPA: RidA family protein [Solirubrobacteraceae bacterium]